MKGFAGCGRASAVASPRDDVGYFFLQTETAVALIRRFCQDTGGATAIEYALIAAGISIVIVGAVNALGGRINDVFYNKIADALN